MQQMRNIYYNNNNNNIKLISLLFFLLCPYFPFHSNDQQVGFLLYNSFFCCKNFSFKWHFFLVQQSKWQISKIFFSIFFLSIAFYTFLCYCQIQQTKKYDMIAVCVCVCMRSIQDTALRITEKWWYTEILLHKKESNKIKPTTTYKNISHNNFDYVWHSSYFLLACAMLCHVSKKKRKKNWNVP